MPDSEDQPHRPAAFAAALDAIRHASPRAELVVTEIPAPGNLAPYSVALSADVTPVRHGSDSDFGTGRFILLYDPDEPESWGGALRVVCFAQAPLETDIGVDPFLAEVAWAWLVDALDSHGARYTAASGTATKILSSGFGELANQGDGAQIEVRASWSPLDSDLAAHVEGWGELLCMLAGLPPSGEPPRPTRRGHPSGQGAAGQARPRTGQQEGVRPSRGNPAHGGRKATAGIPVRPLDPIGPMPVPMRRNGLGLHTLGVVAGGLDSGGMETVGIDTIGLNTLGTLSAGRETVGMNTAGTTTVAAHAIETGAAGPAEATAAPGTTARSSPAGASGDGMVASGGTPASTVPGTHAVGVADLSAHRASRV